jgi:peptide/nickel transport system permease protein
VKSIRRFFASWQNILSLLLILGFAGLTLAAPQLSPMDPKNPGIFQRVGRAVDMQPRPPSPQTPLGTLPAQYDVFHALVWGTGEAMRFGLSVAIVTALIGVFLGAVAGYAGGWLNSLIMRITDAFLAFPTIAGVVFIQQIVAITITAMGGIFFFNNPRVGKVVDIVLPLTGIQAFLERSNPLLISLILFSWMPFTRLVNTLIITLKRTDFIQAAHALGAGPWWIIRRHLIPHAIAPVIVLAARDVGGAVILQATFTFIGIGGNSAWGGILATGRDWVIGPGGNLFNYWWVFLPATLAVIVFGVAWNMLGDGINELSMPLSMIYTGEQAGSPLPPEIQLSKQPVVSDPPLENAPQQIALTNIQPPSLTKARLALQHGQVTEAVESYRSLIHTGQLTEKVIQDLNRAVEQYPAEGSLWEALGEAYNQNGQLAEALQAYEKAIEHLNRIKHP